MSTTAAVNVPPTDPRRWAALSFIALAQLMVVLDATIVNIALPSAQRALGISDADRQWVVTAYTLVFGGLLLLGGRAADLVGRKLIFLIGLTGFAAASALGGAAVNEGMLFGARALQGAFGALLAPAALSLLAVMFTEPRERARAFGVYGAIAGGGAAAGLLLGGVLTEYLNWRWALYVNVPIAVVAFAGAIVLVRATGPSAGRRPRLDLPGAVLVTAGLVALVYGFTRAESEGWRERGVLGLFAAAAVLLIAFVLVEALTKAPLLPLRVVVDRNRGGAYLAIGLAVIAMFGLFLFLTYYLQAVEGYSPLKSGLAFLPFTAGMIIGSTQISARLMDRVPARFLIVPGLLVGALGMGLLTRLEVGSSYPRLVLPAELLLSLGLGTTMMPAMNLATTGVAPRDSGVASAMVNTAQQVGGSIGTALLNTIAATATTKYIASHAQGHPSALLAAIGQVHGYTVAIWWGVGILLGTALLVAVLVNGRPFTGPRAAEAVADPAAHPAGATPYAEAAASRVAHPAEPAPPYTEPAPAEAALVLASIGARATDGPDDDAGTEGRWAPPAPGRATAAQAAAAVSGPAHGGDEAGNEVRGRVRGATGTPVPGAVVTLVDPGGRQLARTAVHDDGSYTVRTPGIGSYVLIATADGHRPQATTVVVGHESLVRDLTLRGGADLTGVVRAAATGAPVAAAMVVLTDTRGDVVGSATTDDDGAFSFDDLVSGPFILAASAKGHRPAAVTVEVADHGTTRCAIELGAAALLRGTVRAGAEDRPLADARVTLVNAAGEVVGATLTDAEGVYSFPDLEAGSYTVVASGYPPVAATLTVDGAGAGAAGPDITLGHPGG